MLDLIASLWDDIANEIKEEDKKTKTKDAVVNEFGDKIGRKEVCQGIVLLAGVGALFTCGCIRGCQEIKKHKAESTEKVQAILAQNQR